MVCFGLKYAIQEQKEEAHVLTIVVVTFTDAFLSPPVTKEGILVCIGTVLMGFGLMVLSL